LLTIVRVYKLYLLTYILTYLHPLGRRPKLGAASVATNDVDDSNFNRLINLPET